MREAIDYEGKFLQKNIINLKYHENSYEQIFEKIRLSLKIEQNQ